MRFSSKSDDAEAEINLTPLIDVVFLLLIFFMVTTTFSREAEIKLKLPEASSAEKSDPSTQLVTIQINDIGQFSVKGPEDEEARELISSKLDTLRKAIKRAAGEMKDPVVLIRADRLTPHEAVVNAMDAARRLGFFQITFATGQEQ